MRSHISASVARCTAAVSRRNSQSVRDAQRLHCSTGVAIGLSWQPFVVTSRPGGGVCLTACQYIEGNGAAVEVLSEPGED